MRARLPSRGSAPPFARQPRPTHAARARRAAAPPERALLLAARHAPGAGRPRCTQVVRYVSAFKHLHLLKPEALIPLMGTNLETGARAAPPDAFWRGVVSKLALTPEQREDVRATHELYQSQLAGCARAARAAGGRARGRALSRAAGRSARACALAPLVGVWRA